MIRVKFITPKKPYTTYVNGNLVNILQQRLEALGAIKIVESSPEIVHIFGLWTIRNANNIQKYRDIGVPVVFTSIEGLSPLLSRSGNVTKDLSKKIAIKSICKKSTVVHTCGPSESCIISKLSRKLSVVEIQNVELTALTTEEKMANLFMEMYKNSYTTNDNLIKQAIDNKVKKDVTNNTIADICSRLMYIRNRFTSGCIRQSILDDTARILTESNYDEDEMSKALDRLGMLEFSAYCMKLLESTTGLTEGFMPIDAKSGKTVKRMQNMIVQ